MQKPAGMLSPAGFSVFRTKEGPSESRRPSLFLQIVSGYSSTASSSGALPSRAALRLSGWEKPTYTWKCLPRTARTPSSSTVVKAPAGHQQLHLFLLALAQLHPGKGGQRRVGGSPGAVRILYVDLEHLPGGGAPVCQGHPQPQALLHGLGRGGGHLQSP